MTVGRAVLIGPGSLFGGATPRPYRAERPIDLAMIRDAIVQARAALVTASGDQPGDLGKPERAQVLARRVEKLTAALAELDRASR